MSFQRLFIVAFAAVLLLTAAGPAAACPMCKAALASADGGGNIVQGFFWSILFMLSMPFTILGVFSGSMYLAVRRARAEQAAKSAAAVAGEESAADATSGPPSEQRDLLAV